MFVELDTTVGLYPEAQVAIVVVEAEVPQFQLQH